MGPEMEPAHTGLSADERDGSGPSADCASTACHLQKIVPCEYLSEHCPKDRCLPLVANMKDGRGRDRMNRKPQPHPFRGTRNSPGEKLGQADMYKISVSAATLHGSLPDGQRPPLSCPRATRDSLDEFDVEEDERRERSYSAYSCCQVPRNGNSEIAPLAAITSRAVWLRGPAKLAPSFAATDTTGVISSPAAVARRAPSHQRSIFRSLQERED
jgi:hypothetical protein